MRRTAVVALALLTAGWAATLVLAPWSDERVNDLYVYGTFAEPVLGGALPYRDVFFEYPPLAAPVVALPGLLGTSAEAFRLAFAGWTLLLAAAVVVLCGAVAARTGGDRRRALLAAALMPLLCGAMVRTHFDLAPVALTLGALLLLCIDRPRTGLAVLGLGAMVKGFPLVVAPVALAWLVGRGRAREAAQGAVALVAVVVALGLGAVVISPDGAFEAVRYHVERPVQVESTPALGLLALDAAGMGDALSVASHRSDALTHPADGLLSGALAAVLVTTIALLAALAARRPGRRELVLAALAAVTAFAVLGKVLSPQFLLWVIPLGALAFAWRMHAVAAAVAAAAVLTQMEFPARYFDLVAREPLPIGVVALRNAALLAALVLAVAALRRAPQRGIAAASSVPRARKPYARATTAAGPARRPPARASQPGGHQQRFDRSGAPVAVGLDQDGVEPGILVGGLKANLGQGEETLEGLLALYPQHAPARPRHADVGYVRRAAGEHAGIGGRHVGVSAQAGENAPVEVPPHRHLLARRLPVHVDYKRVGLAAQLGQHGVDLAEGRAHRGHEDHSSQVDDPQPDGVALDHGVPVAGAALGVVRRSDDARLPVEEAVYLPVAVGVVAQRDGVGP